MKCKICEVSYHSMSCAPIDLLNGKVDVCIECLKELKEHFIKKGVPSSDYQNFPLNYEGMLMHKIEGMDTLVAAIDNLSQSIPHFDFDKKIPEQMYLSKDLSTVQLLNYFIANYIISIGNMGEKVNVSLESDHGLIETRGITLHEALTKLKGELK